MRILFSILLFSAFAIRPAMEISTVMYYQLNINEIIDKYCVNKERPSLNCNGKCYLMSQMKAKTQSSKENSETIIITESFIPLYFQDTTITLYDNTITNFNISHNWKPNQLQVINVSKDIDHPPQHI
ncbi:hypothetical protein [Aquimarina sp. MMG016]|uniref:hypothetical protein n=1 Tax=Aquimarina sp. MMG016 TaxID=2822690 RepID=UPI001B3A3749|nr:hypothetical protein [Aquimarina sp. MMG016]MBQ4822441.1 hypothetical protein [Aquimarina sp. MMG016]